MADCDGVVGVGVVLRTSPLFVGDTFDRGRGPKFENRQLNGQTTSLKARNKCFLEDEMQMQLFQLFFCIKIGGLVVKLRV